MSVVRLENGTIALQGAGTPEDAETLLQMLIASPAGPVDWSACEHLHTAVVQVLLIARPVMNGTCGDAWVGRWIGEPASSPQAAPQPDL